MTLGAFPAATFDGLVVNDVVVSMLDASDFPWEDMDLDHAGLAQASGNAPRITVSVSVTATGSGPLSGALRLSMASGFTAVPGAARISPAPSGATTDLGAPSVVNGQTVWNLTGIQPGTAYTVNVDVWPGLVLGSQPFRGQLDLGGSTQVFSPQAFTVVAPSDAGATRATATNITRDTLVLGYVSSPGDVDVYHFDSSTVGRAPVQIQLGHQAADSDLVVYGPADPQPSSRTARAQPGPGVAPTPDVAGDPSDPAQTGDTKLLTGESVTASSTNAGLADDAVSAVKPDLIQVAGNEGATSPKPYSLRVRVGLNEPQPACAAYSGTGGVAGSASLAALPTGLDTVFLVNQQRLGDKYGTTRAAAVMAALQQLAGRSDLGVHGAVLSVEGDPAVSSAYAAWNAQPCAVANANGVVDAINGLVDRARAARPTLHNLVLVGADDMVPMARLADTTAANGEKQQAAELDPASVLAGTLAQNVFLSDDPYATTSPIAYLNRKLYTPDLAIGRLVEKPEEIITALSEFQANSGVLSPDGGLVTGEDVFADGAGAVADTLQSSLSTAKGSPVSIARLDDPIVANGTWSATALQTGLHSAPKVTGLFGHFDQSALVAGDGSLLDVTDAIGTSGLPGGARLVFSMGCHSERADRRRRARRRLGAGLRGSRRGLHRVDRFRLRHPRRHRAPRTALQPARAPTRRRGDRRRRPHVREADLPRDPGPVRQLRREGRRRDGVLRPPDVPARRGTHGANQPDGADHRRHRYRHRASRSRDHQPDVHRDLRPRRHLLDSWSTSRRRAAPRFARSRRAR